MESKEPLPTLSTVLFNDDGIPKHFHISPNADLIPILVIKVDEAITTFSLASRSIAQIITPELPSILNHSNVKFTNREYNKAKNNLIRALTAQLEQIESPAKVVPKRQTLDSIAGHFHKHNKWVSFSIIRSKDNPNDIQLKYAKRNVGISIRRVTSSTFDRVFESVFTRACNKYGITQNDISLLIREQLREDLRLQYTQLLSDEDKPAYT